MIPSIDPPPPSSWRAMRLAFLREKRREAAGANTRECRNGRVAGELLGRGCFRRTPNHPHPPPLRCMPTGVWASELSEKERTRLVQKGKNLAKPARGGLHSSEYREWYDAVVQEYGLPPVQKVKPPTSRPPSPPPPPPPPPPSAPAAPDPVKEKARLAAQAARVRKSREKRKREAQEVSSPLPSSHFLSPSSSPRRTNPRSPPEPAPFHPPPPPLSRVQAPETPLPPPVKRPRRSLSGTPGSSSSASKARLRPRSLPLANTPCSLPCEHPLCPLPCSLPPPPLTPPPALTPPARPPP